MPIIVVIFFQTQGTLLPRFLEKRYQKSKIQLSTRIIYRTFSKHSRHLYINWCKQERDDDDRILELPTNNRHFVDLSESYLYMVHFGLEPFFGNSKKNFKYIGLL